MKYKLIAVDIDDTLLNREKKITERTKAALLRAQSEGVKLVVASGRLPYGVRPYAEALMIPQNGGCYMGFNGGAILDLNGNLIDSTYLDSKYIEPVYSILRPTNATTMVHKGDSIFCDRKVNDYTHIEPDVIGLPMTPVDDIAQFVDWKLHKILISGEPDELKSIETQLLEKFGAELDIYLSAPWFLEVMPKGISKGIGLSKICAHEGIDIGEAIAFGDSFNDITMIKAAGLGIAMGNAEDELKAVADYVTGDCDNDGIAEAIEKFIFNERV